MSSQVVTGVAGENPMYKELAKMQAEKGIQLQSPKIPKGESEAVCNESCKQQRSKKIGS